MRVRLRLGCLHGLRECFIKVLAILLICMDVCQRYIYSILGFLFVTLFLWWSIGTGDSCDSQEVQRHVCKEYYGKLVTGNLCHDFCVGGVLEMGSCYGDKDYVKSYRYWDMMFKVSSNPLSFWREERVEEGLQFHQFAVRMEELLHKEMGNQDLSRVMNQLIAEFDVNKDGALNLGEAQNLWRLLKQPGFLNFYMFQDTGAVPFLNGTCGGISIWHYLHLSQGNVLYSRSTPWPANLFSDHAYRWTLPNWTYRAKAMLSLVELMEELYEKDGVRYHLCNLNGLTVRHLDSYEIIITEETMLLSRQQIKNKLSNITCRYSDDCTLTPQCQTSCDASTRQCTGAVTRPTITLACDIIEDYLLFDAPKIIRSSLTRAVQRCQGLSSYSQKKDLIHSVVIIDLKNILWNYVQYKMK